MQNTLRIALASLAAGSALFAAPQLKDFAPMSKQDQGKVEFVYDFEPGVKAPRLPQFYQLIKGEGVTGGGGLVLTRPDNNGKYTFYSRTIKDLEPGKSYKLTAMVRVRGLRDGKGRMVNGSFRCAGFDLHAADGRYLSSCYMWAKAANGDSDWQTISTNFAMRKEYGSVRLVLFLRKPYTCRQLVWDNVKLEKLGENLSVYPLLPKQLSLDPAGRIKLRVIDLAAKRELAAFAETSDGRSWYSPVKDGIAEFELGKLPQGMQNIRFHVGDVKQKKLIAVREYPFTVDVGKAPKGAVKTDESGRLTVDGKPFFPIGFYLEAPGTFNKRHAAWLREAGVNTVLPYRSYSMRLPDNKGNNSVEALRKSLDYMHKNGFKVIFGMLEINTRSRITLDRFDGAVGREAVIERIVNGLKDHPALLGWYISDENPISEMDKVSDLRFRISRLDPFHPIATLTNIPDNYIWYGPTGDFMMIDPYPIVDKNSQSMSRIRRSFEMQEKEGRMGVWWVPQTFNWGIYRRSEKYSDFRYPTEEDMRAQTLLALNFRTRGVVFYAYESIRRHDNFDPGASKWFGEQVRKIVELVKSLEPFFIAEELPKQISLTSTGASKVEAKQHTANGRSIVVITSDGPGVGQAVLDVGRDGLKSRFGKTTALGGGKYEFRGENMSGDILE